MAAFRNYVQRTSQPRFTRRAWAAVRIRTRREGDRLIVDVAAPVTFHRTKRAAQRALNQETTR